jgi:sugar/nucleoside kinase (ribokinase family)/fructoselysine-6-P-deglycase FrlB-like protein
MERTRTTLGRRVVVIGNLTIDDVVRSDGSVAMASPGGNAVYAAVAARLWHHDVAVVARCGADLPPEVPQTLRDLGVDTGGLRPVDGPTVRNWVIYEDDGRRRWLYRTPPERSREVAVRPQDVPAVWLVPDTEEPPPVVHIAAMPLAASARLVAHVRQEAPGALITLDTHEDWVADPDAVLALARRVDVFVPSREELTELAGYDDPEKAAAGLREQGVPAVVVKLGAAGALVDSGDVPASRVPAWPADACDPTGAGDTFCGALAAALADGLELPDAVHRAVATAAWAVQSSGSLALADLGPEEAARRFATGPVADEADGGKAPAPGGRARPAPALPSAAAALSDPAAASACDAASASGGTSVPGKAPASPASGSVAAGGAPAGTRAHDIDVMRREIEMIPDVIAARIADPGGHTSRIAAELAARGIEDLFLVGCGDSQFAGQAAQLAFQRHAGVRAHAVHALDFARYQVRYLPERSAVVCVSFSGKVGRTTEAAVQARRFGVPAIALTNNVDGELARAADLVLPVDVPTLGFSPGTSSYLGLLATLDDLALRWAGARGRETAAARSALMAVPALAARTLRENAEPARRAARLLAAHSWVTFLGGGPNEATARFGAAKLFEGPQLLGVSTNIEEWAHEEYFVTRAGTPVVLVAPTGASADRAAEILCELDFVGACPLVVGDTAPQLPALHLPLAPDAPEEFSPLLAALPLSLIGFHLAEVLGKESYNFPSEAAREEHYDTIHRVVIGEPA